MTLLATLDDLESYMGRSDTPFNGQEADQATLFLDMASAAVRAYTTQTISLVEDDTIEIPGSWARYLDLPQRPVVEVSAVSIDDVVVTTGWEVRRNKLRWDTDNLLNYDRRWWWYGPDRTVTVTYTHGYTTIPADVRSVVLSAAVRVFTNPSQVRSEALGAYQVGYTIPGTGQALGFMLNDPEKGMLSHYRRKWL